MDINRYEAVKLNEAQIQYLLSVDKKTRFPNFDSSEVSFLYNSFSLFNSAYANNPQERCFFGGWLSQLNVENQCQPPWKSRQFVKSQNASEYSPSCGGSEYFRCNKEIFGPGPTANQISQSSLSFNSGLGGNLSTQGGICVKTDSSYSGLSQKCNEASKTLNHLRGKHWIHTISNEDFEKQKNSLSHLEGALQLFCSLNQNNSECKEFKQIADAIKAQYLSRKSVETAQGALSTIEEEQCHTGCIEEVAVGYSSNNECDIPRTTEAWKRNCRRLLESNEVPKEAFLFALKAMKLNATGFATDKCYKTADGHFSMAGKNRNDFKNMLTQGLPNKCQLMINDYDERIKTHGGAFKCQTAMYYIDLCNGSGKVQKSYSYVGYGTCKKGNGFENKSGKGTSLLGLFFTNNKTFNFREKDQHYRNIASWIQRDSGTRKIPAVALMGMQQSNNGSAPDYKYLHVGAYTSAGCPSIDQKNYRMIETLANNGPSIVINYKKGQMESLDQCTSK